MVAADLHEIAGAPLSPQILEHSFLCRSHFVRCEPVGNRKTLTTSFNGDCNPAAARDEKRAGTARPRQRVPFHKLQGKIVHVGGIACRHHHEARRRLVFARYSSKPFDSVGKRELRAPKSFYEVSASHLSTKFQALELAIDRSPRDRR